MDGLHEGAREALLHAIHASALIALADQGVVNQDRERLEAELAYQRTVLTAYRNVGVDLYDLGVDAGLIARYLGDLSAPE